MLISDAYREWNKAKHISDPSWGSKANPHIQRLIETVCGITGAVSLLNYGCGKVLLDGAQNYDPAIEGCDHRPDPADLVITTNVLEHVEPDCVDAVLDDLCGLSRLAIIAAVSCFESPNGHLSVHPAEWWRQRFAARWRQLGFEIDNDIRCLFVGTK